ncbi:uncharacterized protein LOC142167250 [Nicotiana tabacum]|uniref:Uncharacterized protein LOC142167250 n=1 Tax=Nicotiana tabacum TaxID=4097 RepID=A0AC58SEW0_TOBAC
MHEEEAEKTAFTTPWEVYCYKVMLFGIKNAGATYMRAMETFFHDMIHKEIEIDQKLRHYMLAYTTHLKSRLKYIILKLMPPGKLAKWQILLIEFDIVYITRKAIRGQALSDYLVENPVDKDYESLTMYFCDDKVLVAGEDITESYPGWRMFFDAAANFKEVGIRAVLISKSGQHYPASAKIRFPYSNNMAEYEACIIGIGMKVDMNIKEHLVIGNSDILIHHVQGEWSTKNIKILPYLHYINELCKKFTKIEFKHVPKIQNEFAGDLATLSSMIQHPDKNYVDPIEVEIKDQHAYWFHVDEEPDGKPWYHDIKKFLETREYPENATNSQKRALRMLANHHSLTGKSCIGGP